jgi:HSP20 family protein
MSADDIWDGFFGSFESMNRRMEDIFARFDADRPGVKTYGYTMYQGPDGVRHVKEFGNTDGSLLRPQLASVREPFTDVSSEDGKVKVIAEIPGVEKKDISLECSGTVLTIDVDNGEKRFHKDVGLPSEVDPSTAKAVYNNGLLEVSLGSVTAKPAGTRIEVM